jgi:hypothetical protein
MKKALLLMIVLMLGLAAASPAMAIDWVTHGAINILGAYYKNVDLRLPIFTGGPPGMNDFGFGVGAADPAWNEDSFFVQERAQIYITARASENLYGTLGLEIDSARWGDADPSPTPVANGGWVGRWNADAVAIEVKNLYIDFKVPEIPVWFRVGIQPYAIRPWIMLCDDGAGISARVALKAGNVKIGVNPFWAKIAEGTRTLGGVVVPTDWTEADDQDLYGVDANVSVGPVKTGMYFIYQARRQLYDTAFGEGDSKQWWIGPYFDLRMGPLAATFDFVFNGGYEIWESGTITVFNINNPHAFPPPPPAQGFSRRHQGWSLRGEASYTINKFRFGMGGVYGTGDDPTTRDVDEGFNLNFNGEAAPVRSDFLILGDNWGLVMPYGCSNNVFGFYKPWSTPGQGIWYVRGFADYQLTSWLKLLVNGGYIGDTVKHGDEFGRDLDDDKSIGLELDAAVQIKIYQNLTLSTAFGYLIGGKALSMAGGWRPQDPWGWVTSLSFVF